MEGKFVLYPYYRPKKRGIGKCNVGKKRRWIMLGRLMLIYHWIFNSNPKLKTSLYHIATKGNFMPNRLKNKKNSKRSFIEMLRNMN